MLSSHRLQLINLNLVTFKMASKANIKDMVAWLVVHAGHQAEFEKQLGFIIVRATEEEVVLVLQQEGYSDER